MPSALGEKSGGDARFVPYLARAAASVGVDGFFYETHINPCEALCDGPNMLNLDELYALVEETIKIESVLKISVSTIRIPSLRKALKQDNLILRVEGK